MAGAAERLHLREVKAWGGACFMAVVACGDGPAGAPPPVIVGALQVVARGALDDGDARRPPRWSELATWSDDRAAEITYVELGEPAYAVAAAGVDVWLARPDGLVRLRADGTRAAVERLPRAGSPFAFVSADDGSLWFVLSGEESWTARLAPDGEQVDVFAAPAPINRATALAVERRPGGDRVWLGSGDAPVVATVEARDGERAVSVVASEVAPPVPLSVASLVVGGTGEVWVGDYAGHRVGRVSSGAFRWSDLPPGVAPSALAIAGDGRPWFAGVGRPTRLGRVRADATVESFVLPQPMQSRSERGIGGLAVAPDGTLWFSVPDRDAIGRVDAAGTFAFLLLAPDAAPAGMAFDARGVLWAVTNTGVARVQPL